MTRRIGRSTVEVIGSSLLEGANRARLGRSTVELVGEALLPARGLELPNIQVSENQTMLFAAQLELGSFLSVSPRGNPYPGVTIGPDGTGLAIFRYAEADRVVIFESEPQDWYGQKIIVSFQLTGDTASLRVNGSPVELTRYGDDPVGGITYGDILGRSPHNAELVETQIAELILFDSAVAEPNITVIEGYLNCKWLSPGGATPENNFCIPEI